MDFQQFLNTQGMSRLSAEIDREAASGQVDLTAAASFDVTRDLYVEAEARGLTLSELLESEDFDPTPAGSPLDAFERQLALAGVRFGGRTPTTVEQFYQKAPSLLPEFMLREIRHGQAMRPELSRLIANTTTASTNRYTPFRIDTTDTSKFSLRPIGEGAEIPQLVVTEQTNAVPVKDYGLALKASYKSLRYRTTSQFRVLLWYIGFKMQTDKIGMIVDVIINGDGNNNPASVINTASTGTLAYADLINLWATFSPYEMNTLVCHINSLKAILTMNEFKDPLAGYRFQQSGDLFSPLGASLVRCDDVPTDFVIGLDNRFAVEEVITQPLLVEYDKIIEQRLEEAVISESVTYAKVLKGASAVLDTVF